MDIKSLSYFVAVAKYLSFTKAAKECEITQTAMSLHISKLESELHMPLFIRNRHSVSLTPGGRVFFEQAQKILKYYKDAVKLAHNVSQGYDSILKVGFSSFLESHYITDYTRTFHQLHPHIKIEPIISKNIYHPDVIRANNIDITICPPNEIMRDEDFSHFPLIRRPLRFVVHSDNPLAKMEKIGPRDLGNRNIYILSSSFMRNTAGFHSDDLQKYGFDPDHLVEVSHTDGILYLVSIDSGVGFIPTFPFDDRLTKFKTVDFSGKAPHADLALVYSNSNQNPALKIFLQLFNQMKKTSSKTTAKNKNHKDK
jgi:DNA-binding transcriptional LysR family regulator